MTEAELVAIEGSCEKVRYAEGAEAVHNAVLDRWIICGRSGTFYIDAGPTPNLAKFWAESATTITALVAEVRKLREDKKCVREALRLAAIRLDILTGRMRACHEETGKHQLLSEAESFCTEARAALQEEAPDEDHS